MGRLQEIEQELQTRNQTRLQLVETEIAKRPPPDEPDFPGASIVEPVRTIATGVAAAVGGGISGLIAALNPTADPEAGKRMVESFERQIRLPKTEAGKESLKTIADGVQKIVDMFNIPASGIGGAIELVAGQGLKQAAETIKSIQERGAGVTAGERVLEETGSPLAATGARILPEAALEFGALKLFTTPTPTKQRITELLQEAAEDVTQQPSPPPSKLLGFIDTGKPKINTAIVKAAVDRGFDETVVAAVNVSGDVNKTKMLRMVDIMEKGKRNKRFAMLNRPSDIAGASLLERFKVVRAANKAAGSELDGVARSLKGKPVDVSSAVNQFIDDLDSIGVRLGPDLKPIFKGSVIEGVTPAERIITNVVRRMRETRTPDAHDVHRLKKFIDEHVTFGKNAKGLGGKAEIFLKDLRHNLDQVLDTQFGEYNRVNTVYSETINALDMLQEVAGKKMQLTGPNADKAVGTLLRRLMSNAQSRVTLLDAAVELERIAQKHAGAFPDDILTLTLFADELDSVFGPVARTSFQGQISQAIQQGTSGQGVLKRAAATGFRKAKDRTLGTDEERAFRAIRRLLEEK